jgi:small nuclear ribonucleoprotein (snRNP)-like protein
MLKKIITALVAILIFNLATVAYVSDPTSKEAKLIEKVRTNIVKLGTGPNAKVELKLKDGSKLKGYVKEADENKFVVVDSLGAETTVPYPNAKQVKGNNLNKRVFFVIGFVAFLVIVLLIGGAGS